ncbi:hypothetical protein KF840_02965 [bacterium]|nr:hypothetical protein [bacterium]
MPSTLRSLAILAALALIPSLAQAGWVIEWSTAAAGPKGQAMAAQKATQSIAKNQVRMDQPEVVTITDYDKDRLVMMNPTKDYFWSGSSSDYLREMTTARDAAIRERIGHLTGKKKDKDAAASVPTPSTVDPSKLPPVSITATGVTEKIAGYAAEKYEVRVDGDLFEEMWIAPVDLSSDLNYDRYLAQQLKNSAVMQGKSADAYNAIYRDPEYRRVTEKALVVKSVTHHVAGTFERTATSVQQRDIPPSTFTVPDSYRKVRLSDLMEPPPTPAPGDASPSGAMPKN